MKNETIALHHAFRSDPSTDAVSVPIYQTTAFLQGDVDHTADVFNLRADGFTYTRILNPTTRVLEKRYAAIDRGVDSLATSSGQAATMLSILNICNSGDNIITSPYLYGNTWNLFKHTFRRLGIEVRVADPRDPKSFLKQTDEKTKCYFGEVLSNPLLIPFPVAYLSELGKINNVPVIVDNTITTNISYPLDIGAAISVYSATKYICGHGTTMGGLVVDGGKFDWKADPDRFPSLNNPDEAHNYKDWYEAIQLVDDLGESAYLLKSRMTWMRDMGACISPFNSFLLIQGLETLPLRMERHCANAEAVAEYLKSHEKVESIVYPKYFTGQDKEVVDDNFEKGYGALVFFEVKGGVEAGKKFIQSLELFYHVANVGDARSLATHPASTTHTTIPREKRIQDGINDGSIRLCIGTEHIDDIIADLDQALSKV